MQTNFTLQLEDSLITQAKLYAERHGQSLSQLVANYFKSLGHSHQEADLVLTPRVRALKGVLRHAQVDEPDYRQYLEEKHLRGRSYLIPMWC
jgi:hypothetical protein